MTTNDILLKACEEALKFLKTINEEGIYLVDIECCLNNAIKQAKKEI